MSQELFNRYITTDEDELEDALYEEMSSEYEREGKDAVTADNVEQFFKPQIVSEIEDKVDNEERIHQEAFAKDDTLLFNYLKENFAARQHDENMLILLGREGATLQPHLFPKKELSNRQLQLEVEMGIADTLKDKGNHPTNFSKTTWHKNIKYAIKQLHGKARGLLLDEETSHKGDITAVKSVMRIFRNANTGKKLDGPKLDDALEGRISADEVVYSPASKEDAEMHLSVLEEQEDELRNAVSGYITHIEEYLNQDEPKHKITRVNLSGEYLIGELNLQSLGSREEIYKYWQGVYRDYEVVQSALNDFLEIADPDKFEDLGDADTEAELRSLIQDLKDLKPIVDGNDEDNLNYVYKVGPAEIRSKSEGDKLNRLFMSLLEDMGLAEAKGADRKVEQEYARMLEEGEINPDESPPTAEATSEEPDMEIRPETPSERESGVQRTESERGEMGKQKPMIEILGQLQELLIEQKEFYDEIPQKVDPLFAYAFNKESGAFKNTAIMASELEKLKIGIETNLFYLDIDYDEDITRWMEKLADYAVDVPDKASYHLPMTNSLRNTTIIPHENWNDKQKAITKFLDTIVGFIERGKGLERSSAASEVPPGKSTNLGIGDPWDYDLIFAPSQNDESLLNTQFITKFRQEFDELLEAIIDFYVIPPSGIYSPFDEEISLVEDDSTRKTFGYLVKGKEDDGFFAILEKERTVKNFVDEEDIKKIAKILSEVSAPTFSEDESQFRTRLNVLMKTVVRGVYGKSPKSIIGLRLKEELGAYFYHMLKKNGHKDPDNEQIWGEDARFWKDEHKKNKRSAASPLVSLLNHIRRNSQGPESIYRRNASSAQRKAILEFNEMRDAFEIVKSETELDILNAHDSIRKMIGKPIYYNTSKLDNFDHMSIAIDSMQKRFKVDVNAFEVENIVNDFGSLEYIGEKYGVPSESVYFLKANFR